MSRGYWSLVLAAFGWLILAGAGPQNKQAPDSKAEQRQAQAPASLPPPRGEEYRPYPQRYAEACYEAEDHEAADLCAQWRAAAAAEKAAKAAERSNWIAGAGALLSFISIILVYIALRQGRQANRQSSKESARNTRRTIAGAAETEKALTIARREASAAAKLTKVAAEHGEKELRAYVDFEAITLLRDTKRDKGDGSEVCVAVHIRAPNFGKTPADDVALTAVYSVVDDAGRITSAKSTEKKGLGSISPGDALSGKDTFHLMKDVWEHVRKNKWRLHVSYELTYTDAFGRPRAVESVFRNDMDNETMGFMAGSRKHE